MTLHDSDTISFLPDLDKASDNRKQNLCRSWKNAVLNDCDVFVENRVDIVVYKTTKKNYPRVTIHCALEYPKVYYSFDAIGNTAGGGGYPGRDSHNFDVHEHAANVALMVEHELRDRVKSYEITDKMIDECIEKFKAAIMSDAELVNGVCNNQVKKCSGCAFADFRYNDAPAGSGYSTFLCTRHHKFRNYGDTDCGEWDDRYKEAQDD